MSKYIDLEPQIREFYRTELGTVRRAGTCDALRYLDNHPDLVPGRTITRSECSNILKDAVKVSGNGDDWERGFCTGLTVGGVKVVPDPEPTNEQSIRDLLEEFAQLNASCGGEQGDHSLAEFLDARGVKVGGDS